MKPVLRVCARVWHWWESIIEEHRDGLAGVLLLDDGARVHRTFVGDEAVPAHRPIKHVKLIADKYFFQGRRL